MTLIIKTIVLTSLLLLVNIAVASEASHEQTDKNKTPLQNAPRVESNVTPQSKTTPPAPTVTPLAKGGVKTPPPASLENQANIGVSNYVQMLFGLFAIVAFIFAVAWLVKRMGTLSPNHSNNLKIIAGLSVGQREKIVVVQVMGEQLLVGITQSNIQLLSKLEQPIPATAMNSLGGFQEKFQSAMNSFKKNSGTGDGA